MSQETIRHKAVELSFTPEISGKPLVCQLARVFDLTFNILSAQTTPRKEGFLTLELIGTEDNIRNSVTYLKEQGVKVTGMEQHVRRDENLCIHCGMCTALCAPGALRVEKMSRLVAFEEGKCTACALCTRICPVKAMSMTVEQGTL